MRGAESGANRTFQTLRQALDRASGLQPLGRTSPPGLASLLGAVGLACALATAAAGADPDVREPLDVFYPGRACASRVLEVEIWDREVESWQPHPDHSRVLADSCQPEEPSRSLHEIRIRCVDPNGRVAASPWRVGLGLAGTDTLDRCADRERDSDGAGVAIVSPASGAVVTNEQNHAEIVGRVGFGQREAVGYEILIAIDVSGSTQQPSGLDVDGDGEVGLPFEWLGAVLSTDPGDSILAAEVKAVQMLVDRLEPGLGPTRVGILTFSGVRLENAGGIISRRPGVRVETPLSDDFNELGAVLDQILATGSGGHTDFFAAVDRSLLELSGRWDALSDARPGARKVLLLLTDGIPSQQSADAAPTRARTLLATRDAADVAIHIYAIGGLANEFPLFVRSLLQNSAGSFTRVSDPSQATSFLDDVSFAQVQRVEIQNLTTSARAKAVRLTPDGQFSGQLPVQSGRNVVLVTAHASDGRQRRTEFELRYVNPLERERLITAERQRLTRERLRKELEIRPDEEVGPGDLEAPTP